MTKKQMTEELNKRLTEMVEIWKFEITQMIKFGKPVDDIRYRSNEYSARVAGFLRAVNVMVEPQVYDMWSILHRDYLERANTAIDEYSKQK